MCGVAVLECRAAHLGNGSSEQLTPAVIDKLKALYPDDKAVGYRPGDIRGAMTIRKPV